MTEQFVTVAATGHRPRDIGREARRWLDTELPRVAAKLVDQYGMKTGISGMALGTDTLWAKAVLGAEAQLWSYIPSPDQTSRWTPHDHQKWLELRAHATRERVFGPRYDVRLLHVRNRAMVYDSDLLVAVMAPHRTAGGTATTLQYAHSLDRPVILVDITNQRTTLIRRPAANVA